ncbi:MAG: nitroreductase family deazaflavin-dependent oxidoreductase [Actinomycetota bacterium]
MRNLLKVALTILGVAVVALALDMVLTTWVVRSRNPRALHLVKRVHRLTNPMLVRFAGQPGGNLATVHHVGRRTGMAYTTPVMAHQSHGDVIIPLPYGTDVDWLRNIQSAGHADVDLDGQRFTVDQPVVVDIDEVVGALPTTLASLVRSYRTRIALRLHVSTFSVPASA